MSQSFARLYVHVIFSTKNRERVLHESVRPDLYAYMGGILNTLGCTPLTIGGIEDHVHILLILNRNTALADVMETLKRRTSKWLRQRAPFYLNFAWQEGYGAFTVSESMTDNVRQYILNQEQHHHKKTFAEEFKAFLDAYHIDYDPRYL